MGLVVRLDHHSRSTWGLVLPGVVADGPCEYLCVCSVCVCVCACRAN